MARKKQRMSPKKMVAAITAVTLTAVMLTGGAFAWHDFSQSAINRNRGIVSPDVLLHDDFADEWVNGKREKDVYVENTGDVDTIVRIRFSEFLQIGNDKVVGTNSKDVKTWEVHKFDTATTGLPGHDASKAHEYFSWNMDGDQKVYLTDTSEMGYFEYNKADYTFTVPHPITSTVMYSTQKGPNGQPYSETLPEADVVSMAYYSNPANKATIDAGTGCWIVDTDGWCYWSKQLKPGEATNMLLSSIEMIENPNDNYAYNIYVDLQACNATEINDMIGKGMTQNAEDNLINDLVGLVAIDSINFPDPVFRDAVLTGFDRNSDGVLEMDPIDVNGDGKLSESERMAVTRFDITGLSSTERLSVTSAKGIELFENLKELQLMYLEDLETIDLSKNTKLESVIISSGLKSIDVQPLKELKTLTLWVNSLNSIDVTENTKLRSLEVSNNNISILDVTNNKELQSLQCSTNSISVLDISNTKILSNAAGPADPTALRIFSNNMTSLILNQAQYDAGVGTGHWALTTGNSGLVRSVAP